MKEEYISNSEVAILNNITLRPYQEEAKIKIFEAWEEHNSVMFQMPTGTGKTILFSSIIRDLHDLGAVEKRAIRVLVLAHRKELIDQISESLGRKYKVRHGIIKADYPEEMSIPNQVASVQTLSRRLKKWGEKDFDFIIIDEAHHALAETYVNIIETFPNAKILGVTATPYRLNREPFTDIFNTLIISKSIKEFIDDKHLCDYKYFSIKPSSFIQKAIDNIDDFDIGGDYANAAMSRVCDNRKVRAGVYETYDKYAKGKKGIIYTINQEHNHNLAEKFIENGVRVATIDSKTNGKLRNEIVKSFRKGDIDVLFNVNIFSEGFDCPDVEFILLARPTMSLSLYLQQVGRGFRTHLGKEEVLLLDNVGSYNKFGLPSARRKWQHHFDGDKHWQDKGVFEVDKTDNHSVNFFDIVEGDEETDLIYTSKTEEKNNEEAVNIQQEDIATEQEEVKTIENQSTGFVSRKGIALDFEYNGYRIFFNANIKEFEARNLKTDNVEYSAFGQGLVKKWIDNISFRVPYKGYDIVLNNEKEKNEEKYNIVNSKTGTTVKSTYSIFKAKEWIDEVTCDEIYIGYRITFDRIKKKYVAICLEAIEKEHSAETLILVKKWIDKITYRHEYKGFLIYFCNSRNHFVAMDLETGSDEYSDKEPILIKEWIDKFAWKIESKTKYNGYQGVVEKKEKKPIYANVKAVNNTLHNTNNHNVNNYKVYNGFEVSIDKKSNKFIAKNQLTNKIEYSDIEINHVEEWIDKWSKEGYKEKYNGVEFFFNKVKQEYTAINPTTKKTVCSAEGLNQIKEKILLISFSEDYKKFRITFDFVLNQYVAKNILSKSEPYYGYSLKLIKKQIGSFDNTTKHIEKYKGFEINYDLKKNLHFAINPITLNNLYFHKKIGVVRRNIDRDRLSK